MSPLPNHLSLSPPPLLFCTHLFSSPGSRCWVVMFTPTTTTTIPSHSLSLSFSWSLFRALSLSLSLAAGRRREKAITAAHEGGWKKKEKRSTQGKQLKPPQGCQLQSPPPPQTHTPKPHLNLWRFLTRQTEGKTVAVGRHRVAEVGLVFLALPGDLSLSEQEFALPEGLCIKAV